MSDQYVRSHANEGKRAELMQSPHVIRALEEAIKSEFAKYGIERRVRTGLSIGTSGSRLDESAHMTDCPTCGVPNTEDSIFCAGAAAGLSL
jgi:hypothetical protein